MYDAATGLRIRNTTYRASIQAAEGVEISEQTASRDLRALAEAGLLVAHGERRGRTYTAGSIMRDLTARVRDAHRAPIPDPFA